MHGGKRFVSEAPVQPGCEPQGRLTHKAQLAIGVAAVILVVGGASAGPLLERLRGHSRPRFPEGKSVETKPFWEEHHLPHMPIDPAHRPALETAIFQNMDNPAVPRMTNPHVTELIGLSAGSCAVSPPVALGVMVSYQEAGLPQMAAYGLDDHNITINTLAGSRAPGTTLSPDLTRYITGLSVEMCRQIDTRPMTR